MLGKVLTAESTIAAYKQGVFPMADNALAADFFWVEPVWRGILPLDRLRVSTSLKKSLKKFDIRFNQNFEAVITNCASVRKGQKDTWINPTIRAVYGELFAKGVCHTVEVYQDDVLVGGLYGLAIGGAFFGESMFHHVTDASKVALVALVTRLKAQGFILLDTQFITPHLESLGAIEIKQSLYKLLLSDALKKDIVFS